MGAMVIPLIMATAWLCTIIGAKLGEHSAHRNDPVKVIIVEDQRKTEGCPIIIDPGIAPSIDPKFLKLPQYEAIPLNGGTPK